MRRVIAVSLFYVIISFQSFQSFAQTSTQQAADKYADKLRTFEEFVRQQMEKDRIPGLTIGFYKDGYTWVKGFGYADLENKIPAKPESAYRLASITKTFMGVAILQLVEKGKMSLDGEIQTYLPYYPKQKWPVTVKQLLVHTGGGQYGSGLGPTYVSPREVVERIAKNPIQFEPGTKFEYTTSGYNLLGAAIEEVTKMSLNDYLKKNVFEPLGLNDTRMDSVRDIIPNRVRAYELVKGEIKNIEHLDVSSRFGGGGLTGTVPELLRWAQSVDDRRVLSKESTELMYTPVTLRDGRYVGGDRYYTLGWLEYPLHGRMVLNHDGGQIGTSTALIRIPSIKMAIAVACNIANINKQPYIRRLYELITDEPYEIRIYAKKQTDHPILTALNHVFDYGTIYFERTKRPLASDQQELAKAFAYFNRVTGRSTIAADYQAAMKAIEDGRHPVGGDALIKVGSYIVLKLREKHGADYCRKYSVTPPFSFFADYIELYKADPKHPRELRFDEAFERIISRWNQDWARTWNDYTRRLEITPQSDFDAIGAKLKPLFANAEVYPNLIDQLLANQEGVAGLKAGKLTAELYPTSARANGNWGLFLLLMNQSEERRNFFRKNIGELEPAMPYFKKSLALQSDGFASPRILGGMIMRDWLRAGRLDDTLALINLALELHPKEAQFHAGLCEIYSRKGMKEKAVEACKKALELDPNFVPAQELMKKLVQ